MTTHEERAQAADQAAQERGAATAHDVGMQSPGYIQVPAGMHPDHDEAVMFNPGELLPDWAAEAMRKQRPEPDEHGTYHLSAATRRPKARRATK
jgi:hypothetical protein